MKWLDFDPHVTFLKLKSVAYVIITILVSALLITLTILVFTPNLKFNPSSEGWNNAIEIFKFPLGLLAVSIPLIALFAANHRSVQSKAQMELTQSQIKLSNIQLELTQSNNHLTNYYKHVDEFQKYLETHVNNLEFIDGNKAQVAYPRKLHKMIFPGAKRGALKVDEDFIKVLCSDMERVIAATDVFRGEKYENRATHLHILNVKIDRLAKKYQVTGHRKNGVPQMTEMNGELVGTATISDFLYPFGLVSTVITESLLFDESFEAPPLIDQIARFDWQNVRPDKKISNSMNYHFDHLLADDATIMAENEGI
ncbi:hypothetical protein ABEH28_08135 [Pseudomonas sp. Ps21-P2]|uniref:hypothetical protein n=1 Tax=Pseudomonas sp. Ps21-P2 TaxID=3080331 RepID=UPI0032092AB2